MEPHSPVRLSGALYACRPYKNSNSGRSRTSTRGALPLVIKVTGWTADCISPSLLAPKAYDDAPPYLPALQSLQGIKTRSERPSIVAPLTLRARAPMLVWPSLELMVTLDMAFLRLGYICGTYAVRLKASLPIQKRSHRLGTSGQGTHSSYVSERDLRSKVVRRHDVPENIPDLRDNRTALVPCLSLCLVFCCRGSSHARLAGSYSTQLHKHRDI